MRFRHLHQEALILRIVIWGLMTLGPRVQGADKTVGPCMWLKKA